MSVDKYSATADVVARLLLLVTFAGAFVVSVPGVAASRYNPLPVEQRDAVDTHYPSAQEYPSQPAAPSQVSVPVPAQATQPSSVEASSLVQVSQPLISGDEQWQLYNQIQQMQEELQSLRGLLEQQTHELEQMKRQQRERYLDLDHRLGQLKRTDNDVAAPAAIAPASVVPASLSEEEQVLQDTVQYDAAFQLLKERKYSQAIEAFQALLVSSPGGKKAPYCEYWLGELYLASSPADLDRAKTHFVTLLTQYPGHVKMPDGMYKLGTVFDRAGDKSKARVTLKRVIKDHAGSQAAKLAEAYLRKL